MACTGVIVGKLYGGVERNERIGADRGGWMEEN